MNRLLTIALLLAPVMGFSQEPAPVPVTPAPTMPAPVAGSRQCHAPKAWLGLEVSKPDETITAHLPDLPPGFGFIVRSVEKGGPADQGGLKSLDVLWKLGDQMLVNESQLACLLRLAEPGDEVTLSCFRSGRPVEIKVKLGGADERKRPFPDEWVEDAILPGVRERPMRPTEVNMANKSASYTSDKGKAEVRKEGEVYKLRILGPAEEVIYDGDFPSEPAAAGISEDWRRRIFALRRGLDHALDGRMVPTHQPRPRVLQPAPTMK